MTRVLLIGYAPRSVDYSDPALPPGLNAETIQAGIDRALRDIRDRGWEVGHCMVDPDETAGPTVTAHLAAHAYDCVVIGGGIRLSAHLLERFEDVINAVHKGAPGAAIAFNTRPDDSAAAVQRRLNV